MGKCIASNYIQPEVKICENCFHREICSNRDYLSENTCGSFANSAEIEAMKAENERLKMDCRGKCSCCKHYTAYHRQGECEYCKYDSANTGVNITHDKWEWRGLEE